MMTGRGTDPVRVLLVERDREDARRASTTLERERDRFEVLVETDPEGAVDRVADGEVDCVVTRYDLPNGDGLDLLERVRAVDSALHAVLLDGTDGELTPAEARDAGATEYRPRPPDGPALDALAPSIEAAVERRRAEQRARERARIDAVVRDCNRALVRASSRADVERGVTEAVADSSVYRHARFVHDGPGPGATDSGMSDAPAAGEFVRGSSDGAGDAPRASTVIESAVRTGAVSIERNAGEGSMRPEGRSARAGGAVAGVPITHSGDVHGALVVSTDRETAFDDRERAQLASLGETVGHALHSVAVRTELERYETIVQASGDPVYVLDERGRYTFVNDVFVEMAGYAKSDLLGSHVSILMDDDDVEEGMALIRELVHDDDRDRDTLEMAAVTADGERVTCEVQIALLPADDGFTGTVGVVRDITDRKRRERELERYGAIMDAVPLGIFLLDDAGEIIEANEKATSMIGYSTEEWVGESFLGLVEEGIVPETAVDTYLETVRELLSSDTDTEKATLETRINPRGADDWRPVKAYFTLLPYEEDFRGTVGVYQDITERKRREQALEEHSDRLEFLNHLLRHEILNGMQVIGSRAEFLEETLSGQEARHAATIGSWSDDITDLVERVRAVLTALTAESAAETDATETGPIDLTAVVEERLEVVRSTYPDVEVTAAVEDGLTVEADEMLADVVANLLANAVEHNPDSDPRIRVTARERARDGTVRLRVADNGPGIPDERKEALFGRGTTGAAAGSEGSDGGGPGDAGGVSTGFGLFFVATMVDRYGGAVRVEDNDPEGSVFVVDLPVSGDSNSEREPDQ